MRFHKDRMLTNFDYIFKSLVNMLSCIIDNDAKDKDAGT